MEQLSKILDGCKRNDRQSQEWLYRQFYPAMFTLCKKFFAEDHEIQTALNNGMIRIFKNVNSYSSQKGEFFNWCYTIVRNSCLTMLRDRRKEMHLEYREEIPDTLDDTPFSNASWDNIFEYLSILPPTTRAVCSLFYLEDFSIQDIVKEIGIKEGTVKWHLNESRRRLKDIFLKSKESNS